MARNDPQVNLRIPEDLKDRLDNAAQASKRSLTAEIVARLEQSFRVDFDAEELKLIEILDDREGRFLAQVEASIKKIMNERDKSR